MGAGAGRAAAHLQDAGHPVVALDPSPGAVAVCRSRGIQSMFTGNVFELAATTPEPFDTFLLLGNNLGLLAGAEQAPLFLAALAGMAQPGARIIGETTDPYRTSNPAHLDYHDQNRRLGRLPGQLRLRVRHHRIATPWWDYLFCTAEELHQILSPTQWELVETNAADNVDSDGPGGWPPAQWAAILALRP
ncbi:MAG: methyltransferase domain-containing protein [Acidimicrobiales bacterium]